MEPEYWGTPIHGTRKLKTISPCAKDNNLYMGRGRLGQAPHGTKTLTALGKTFTGEEDPGEHFLTDPV